MGKPRPLKSLAAHYMPQSGSVDALILTKTNARATVHRPGYMDYIGVLRFDKAGNPVAEQRFLGLYTSSAYNRRPWDIPLVRERHEYVMRKSGLVPTGHSGKALRHPRDPAARRAVPVQRAGAVRHRDGHPRPAGTRAQPPVPAPRPLRPVLVGAGYIPRERMSTRCGTASSRCCARRWRRICRHQRDHRRIAAGAAAHDRAPAPGRIAEVDRAALDEALAHVVRDWQDELRELLVERNGEEQGLRIAARYGRALPAGYIEEVSPAVAATDVEHLAALDGDEDLRLSLYRSRDGSLRFKFYRRVDDIPLSDALPMMENMGLRVISEHPYRIDGADGVAWIQDFEVETANRDIDVDSLDENFEEAFAQMWRGQAENDGFKRLILAANLSWRQVSVLRAYCKLPAAGRRAVLAELRRGNPGALPALARLLVELFEARFDPSTGHESKAEIKAGAEGFRAQFAALAGGDAAVLAAIEPVAAARSGKREAQVEAVHDAIKALLDRVTSLDEDRILRSYVGVIDALRTSYYIDYKHGLRADGGPKATTSRSSSIPPGFRTCPSRARTARSGCAARAWKASTCASGRSRAAACAGPTAARTSAPRCWAWSRRRW